MMMIKRERSGSTYRDGLCDGHGVVHARRLIRRHGSRDRHGGRESDPPFLKIPVGMASFVAVMPDGEM